MNKCSNYVAGNKLTIDIDKTKNSLNKKTNLKYK